MKTTFMLLALVVSGIAAWRKMPIILMYLGWWKTAMAKNS